MPGKQPPLISQKVTDATPFPTEKSGKSHLTLARKTTCIDNLAPLQEKQPPPLSPPVEKLDEIPKNKSFSELVSNLDNTRMTEKPKTTSSHIVKLILNSSHKYDSMSDDETVVQDKNPYNLRRIRMSIMIAIPGTDKGIDEEEAPLEAIRQLNTMIKSLINETKSIKLGPWSPHSDKRLSSCWNYLKI